MIKKTTLTFFAVSFILCLPQLWGAAQFKTGTLPLVDGVYNSTQAVITNRQPVFSWEFDCTITSFTIVVSSDPVTYLSSGELWNYVGSTDTTNTINFITRIAYNNNGTGTTLSADTVYYWQVTIYSGDSTSASSQGQFTAVSSGVTIDTSNIDLAIDWNNPFDPGQGQTTVFRFASLDRDRTVKIRVFSISGELVTDWPETTILKDAFYTITWDGRNSNGNIVARGIYFVNLADVHDNTKVTRRLAVLKK